MTNLIETENSYKNCYPRKICLTLKKAIENVNWISLEKGVEVKPLTIAAPITTNGVQKTPSYPSSSKIKKNWDKIDKEITKEESKDKPEGDAALNALFKQIYERADENTRRAMIKSYQTSGGTVLPLIGMRLLKRTMRGRIALKHLRDRCGSKINEKFSMN